MFIRNGINSNLRERGRTTLFTLLIVFLTITMILSISVLLYCNAVIEACDEAYRSIALVEYMGSEYPNEDVADAAAREAAGALSDESVLSIPGVRSWTRANTASGYIKGYERRLGPTPYGKRGVIVVSHFSKRIYQSDEFDDEGNPIINDDSIYYYTCLLNETIYTQEVKEGIYIDILTADSGFEPEQDKTYVLNGSFVDTTAISRQIGEYPMNGLTILRIQSFLDADDLPYAEIAKGEDIPEIFLHEAELYNTMNNYVRVVPCRDVNDLYEFQQNELQLAEGAMPDPGTPNACVISSDLAKCLDLKPGDEFTLDELQGTDEDRYKLKPADGKQTYTVSGIASDSFDYGGTVWAIAEDADTPLFGYQLGTASLDNEQAVEAAESLQELVPEQVRVTLLDQGYTRSVQPFREVKKTAVNVLIVCAAGVAAVLLLFAFLFVGRQSETVKIMVSLGTPSRRIAQWFLSGALVICGAAAIIGTVIGTVLRPIVISMIARNAASAQSEEGALRYSETSIGVVKQMDFDLNIPHWPNILAALGVIALALIFCLLFLRLARRSGTRKRGKSRVRVPHGVTSIKGRGGLRFALLSIRRGGLRSLVVPMVSLALTIAVIVLGGVYQNWQNELDEALDNARIDGIVVSLDGRHYSDLFLTVEAVKSLVDIEGIEDISVSGGYHYWLPEEVPAFSTGDTGQWRRYEWIGSQPEIVPLNSLAAAKEFYYSDPSITWLEGWDESMLAETDVKPMILRFPVKADPNIIPIVCSTDFLESHDMVLGDTLSIMSRYEVFGKQLMEIPLIVQAVGSYVKQEDKEQIYAPLSLHLPQAMLFGGDMPDYITESDVFELSNKLSLRTCRFHLASARELDAVRERLEDLGFSAVGQVSSIRTTLLLRDAAFLKFKQSMERNITMGRVMTTMISLLIVLLGFIISWLMTFSRRREFALMRGFGVNKRRVFASFFLEQAILSFIGCLIGCMALIKLYAGGATQPLTVAAFILCYLLGTAVSIMMIGKTDLMELLTVRD
ncbi:MAG: hypothetical protein IKS99_03405 [Firmicutes bacterium]|nr:hypothetical protein [Bacillota bacterium]